MRSDFEDWSQSKQDQMRNTVEMMKVFPNPQIESHILQMMLKKWAKASRAPQASTALVSFGEKKVAGRWAKGWAHDDWKMMRTSLNPIGGLPTDNQGLEGKNGSQKQSALFKRQGLTQFTPDFVEWLTNESLEDTSMGMAMPKGRYGEEVWTSAFFDSVTVELGRRQQGTGIFVCAFDRTDGDNQPTGVTDIASRRLITLLTGPAYKVRDEKEALRKALTKSQRAANPSWLDTYRKVITCTAEDAPDLGLSFDELIDYSSAFHALTPITDAVFTARLAERLVRSGMVLDLCSILCDGQAHGTSGDIEASSFDLGKLAKYGFRSCTCKTFTHYLWCIHSCGDAKLRKLIKSWPATLDPTRLGDRRTGAIPNAVRGGALGRM